MEWIQRNPKKAIAVAGLAVLVVVSLLVGMSGGSKPAGKGTLGTPLATPTATPTTVLTGLPDPAASPTGAPNLASLNGKLSTVGALGNGMANSLEPHHIQLIAGADNGLTAVGWKMPHAKGPTSGLARSPGKSWTLDKTAVGPPLVGLYTYVSEVRGAVWCTIKVDGKVVEHQEAQGPWGQVYCGA